jgi:hypothetical protein
MWIVSNDSDDNDDNSYAGNKNNKWLEYFQKKLGYIKYKLNIQKLFHL